MKILLVEDEPELAEEIRNSLEEKLVPCTHVETFELAREALHLYGYDLLLLDAGLPDGNGLELIKMAQRADPVPGIIVISARGSLDDRLKGLDLGADDYITKPFHMAELHARIRSVHRRKRHGGHTTLRLGSLELVPEEFDLRVDGEPVSLSPKEFQLLAYFIANRDRVVSRESIAEHLWGDQADMLDDFDFIYSHVKNLRRKLTAAGAKDRIKAVYGIGYKFDGA